MARIYITVIHSTKTKRHIREDVSTGIVEARQDAVEQICWKPDRYATIHYNGKVIEKLENYYDSDKVWAGIRSIVNGKIKYDVTADGTVLKWKGVKKYPY